MERPAKVGSHLYRLSVETSPEAEETVSGFLSELLGPSAAYTNVETRKTVVSVWLNSRSEITDKQIKSIKTKLRELKGSGIATGSGEISVTRVRREDWAESWKRHFKPLVVDGRLIIRPSWTKPRLRGGQSELVLDPGLSFGTGNHPTTAFCLQEVARLRKAGERQSFLDVGTGTGILALAAARLGYKPVVAFDFDPEAVNSARANARCNGLAGKLKISLGDVRELKVPAEKSYSLVCANLIADLLQEQMDGIVSQVSADGALVVAGILKSEFHLVAAAVQKRGLKLVKSRAQKEWRSGTFTWRNPK